MGTVVGSHQLHVPRPAGLWEAEQLKHLVQRGRRRMAGPLAVVINAIADALGELGVRHVEMPATPERVWRAIRGAAGGAA